MNLVLSLLVVLGYVTQDSTANSKVSSDEAKDAEARLEFVKQSLHSYELFADADRRVPLARREEPILRWNNPVSGVKDGFVFIAPEEGRPEVAIEVLLVAEGFWVVQFQSLTDGTLIGDRDKRRWWFPAKPGVERKRLPGSAVPAATLAQRLVQMRAMARDFKVSDNFRGEGWWELRLLPQPIHRFGGADEILDGALFAFVQGTNPEALLLIEARKADDAHEWTYALAPITGYELEVSFKGSTVWTIPWRKSPRPDEPFFVDRVYPPVGTRLQKVPR